MGAMDANFTSKIPAVMVSSSIKKILQPKVCNMNTDSNSNTDNSNDNSGGFCANSPIIYNANTDVNNTLIVSLSFDNAPTPKNTAISSYIDQFIAVLLESVIPLLVLILLIVSISNIEYKTIVIISNFVLTLVFILIRLPTLRTSTLSDSYNHQGKIIPIHTSYLLILSLIFRN